jgi:hypothetical protein
VYGDETLAICRTLALARAGVGGVRRLIACIWSCAGSIDGRANPEWTLTALGLGLVKWKFTWGFTRANLKSVADQC